jgi:transposase
MTEREAQLEEELRKSNEKIRRLEETVAALLKRIYGAKSEKIDPAQLELLLAGDEPGKAGSSDGADAPAEDDAANAKRPKRKKRQGPRWPENAPVIIEAELVPEEVLANPEDFREIDPELSDMPDFVPGRFVIRRTVRRKFVSKRDRSRPPLIVAAPAPPIPGTRCAPGLAAHVLMAKYALHQPLYRIEYEFSTRYEVYLPRQTLDHWVMCCATRLRAVARAIELEVLLAFCVQLDDTPIKYLAPGHGRTREGRLWIYNDPAPGGSVCYRWHTSRGYQCPESFLVDEHTGELLFTGPLQGDCYSAHYKLVGIYPELDLIGCMAHMRRYFTEALDRGERRYSPLVIRLVANLYAIETWLRDRKAGPALRDAVRASQSAPILRRLHRMLTSIRSRTLPAGALGQAVNYALNHWEKLVGYLKDGRLEIDNNASERAVRPTKLGMRNWLFIGAAEAGWAAAVIYTLVENCKRHGLDPYAYLKDVLTRLPQGEFTAEDVAHLTPARIAGVRRQPRRHSAA